MIRNHVRNFMEEIVWNQLEDLLPTMPQVCSCDICLQDMFAFALNQLPPRYIATTGGEVYTKLKLLEAQYHADILAALTKAVKAVSEHPRHDASVDQ
ncbi:late competence development ComFB family protein [Fodinisporobacter ferrooxydans]|uniref:Late competence development ComFB family protein n=1 Tax=Fodinisporobacter ferrooxydans TaxID=2901836 RepID=A0ABY4CF53_9BACL|nr:late competence development ComFB family protein [Alicyclobacillaceae bacterium MYW30-H2]